MLKKKRGVGIPETFSSVFAGEITSLKHLTLITEYSSPLNKRKRKLGKTS